MKIWKFISRSSNYRVTLKHGIPAEPLTGRNATPGVYAKFEDGILTVKDEEMANMLMNHSAFGSDFILTEDEDQKDPYYRNIKEPEHNITEIQYGAIGKSLTPKPKLNITPETKRALEEMAEKMAEEKFAQLLDSFVKKNKEMEEIGDKLEKAKIKEEEPVEETDETEEAEEETPVKKAGRPKKKK